MLARMFSITITRINKFAFFYIFKSLIFLVIMVMLNILFSIDKKFILNLISQIDLF